MMKRLLSAFVLWAAGVSAAAAGVFYDCDLDTKIQNGWVSPKVGIVIDDAGKATVIDSAILHFVVEPLAARVKRNGDRLRVTWNLANAKDAKGQRIPTFRYIATLNTGTNTISVIAKPAAAPQRWSAKGTCKSRTK
jgi:hypothetical protein